MLTAAFASFLATGPASALTEPRVEVACDDLSADDVAEVEARTRATLLTEPDGADVRVDCAGGSATVVVTTRERSETAVLLLPRERAKDAVLGVIERLLETSREPSAPALPVASAKPPSIPPAPAPEHRAGAPDATPRSVPAASSPAPRPEGKPSVRRVSASLMVAQFSKHFAFGGRASVETGSAPWAAGIAVGGVTGFEIESAFVATEWHGLVFGSVDDRSWPGLRFSFGFGASVLRASPSSGLVARSGTTITSGFTELGVARPLRFGQLAVTPGLVLRLFPAERRVRIDGTSRFELPIASVAGLLGLSLDI